MVLERYSAQSFLQGLFECLAPRMVRILYFTPCIQPDGTGPSLVHFQPSKYLAQQKRMCPALYLVLQGLLRAGPASPKDPTSCLEGQRHNWGQERLALGCPINSGGGGVGPALGPGDSVGLLRQREEGRAFSASERASQTPGNHNEPSTFTAQQGERFQKLF